MVQYALTQDPNVVVRVDDQATIPKGHRWWDDYQTWLAAGNTPTPLSTLVTTDMVNTEKERRTYGGFTFQSNPYQSDRDSYSIMNQLASLAFAAITNGAQAGDLRWADPDKDFFWIAANNVKVPMDAQTVVALNQAAASWRTMLTYKASDIKALSPIPADYTDDKYWSF